MSKKEYKVVDASKEDLEDLYNSSALTFEGCVIDDASLDFIFNEFKEIGAIPKDNFTFYHITGKLMNDTYKLTGDNRYPNNLNILSIMLDNFEDSSPLITWRFQYGGRWMDDVVDNNARRER